MGNEISDVAYGPTESAACIGIVSGLKARYPKIKQIITLGSDKTPSKKEEIPFYLQIDPYGLYRLIYGPINGQIIVYMEYISQNEEN